MLEIFKKNTFISLVLLIPYAMVLHLSPWFTGRAIEVNDKNWIFNKFIVSWISSGTTQLILSTILIVLTSLILAQIVSKFKLMPDAQLFPSLFYILYIGLHYRNLELSAMLVGNVFFSISLLELLKIYQKKQVPLTLFNFGFFVGIASLFYLPYFYYLLAGVIGLIILRGFKPRELFQILGGFANVYMLLMFALYLYNLHSEFYQFQIAGYFRPFIFSMQNVNEGWVMFGIIMASIIYALINYANIQIKKSIAVQKIYDILFWCLLISLFSIFFLRIDNPAHLILVLTPLSILCGLLFSRLKNPLIAETLHLFMIVISLFLQFQNW
ncbi:MAG: hypothetical protein IPM34_04180 [Saprospiraceae bacterium]|nr:hypothetical protein [Saprospiraceae bacterium]